MSSQLPLPNRECAPTQEHLLCVHQELGMNVSKGGHGLDQLTAWQETALMFFTQKSQEDMGPLEPRLES